MMADLPVAHAAQGGLVVTEEAQATRLHNRLVIGRLEAGVLHLTNVEAAWALATGKLDIAACPMLGEFLAAHEGLETEFLVYADLRERGLNVQPRGDGVLAVWPRGAKPETAPPGAASVSQNKPIAGAAYEVQCHAERGHIPWSSLVAGAHAGRVAAVVDDDGRLTHYTLGIEEPKGTWPAIGAADLPGAAGTVLHDRVLVEAPAAARFHAAGMGTLQDGRVMLSFVEAEHARRAGLLRLSADVTARAASRDPAFNASLAVYGDLRSRGVLPKSGLKFGTHLRGYRGSVDADHAQWLIHCTTSQASLEWSDLSRGVRLAHGVRKTFVAAAGSTYVRLTWFRP